MKYPINADEYIAAVREASINISDQEERYYRETVIPLINSVYRDGQQGSGAFPRDPDESIEEYAQHIGHAPDKWSRDMMRRLIEICNDAYAQGQQHRKGGSGMKITISYLPEHAKTAAAVIGFVRKLLPSAVVRSSVSKPPRKIVYVALKSNEKRCGTTKKP